MNRLIQALQRELARDFTLTMLKLTIILWCLFIAWLALAINDKWILAGIMAYEFLP